MSEQNKSCGCANPAQCNRAKGCKRFPEWRFPECHDSGGGIAARVTTLEAHLTAMCGWFDLMAEKIGWTAHNAGAAFDSYHASRSALQEPAISVHERFSHIPAEPTPAMIEAGEALIPWTRGTESRRGVPDPETIYRAMVAAAPMQESRSRTETVVDVAVAQHKAGSLKRYGVDCTLPESEVHRGISEAESREHGMDYGNTPPHGRRVGHVIKYEGRYFCCACLVENLNGN